MLLRHISKLIKNPILILIASMNFGVHAAANDRYEGPIIDMHLHASDWYAENRLCFPQPCKRERTIARNGDEVRTQTVAAMHNNNIVLAFLSGKPAELKKWSTSAPGRFIFSPLIDDPKRIDFGKLRAAFERGDFHGMGELTTQYNGYAPNDPVLEPFFALAEEFDVPVHIHTLGIGTPTSTFRVSNGDPRLLEDVLARHPNLRLYVENCGFPFVEEITAMMYQYPQLYCEISTILHLTPRKAAMRHFKTLIDNELGKRIMFGSDQMIWPEVIPIVIEAIQTADFLSPEQKKDIFYNNAARFLRLEQDEIARHHEIVE